MSDSTFSGKPLTDLSLVDVRKMMDSGELQEIPEICNCQEPKCIKRVDAAIEAVREAAARECEDRLKRIMPEWMQIPGTLKTAIELRGAAKAIRALSVEDLK